MDKRVTRKRSLARLDKMASKTRPAPKPRTSTPKITKSAPQRKP